MEYASEFRYRNPVIHDDDVVIALSQSGETADTLAAIELARNKGAFVFGICSDILRRFHAKVKELKAKKETCRVKGWNMPLLAPKHAVLKVKTCRVSKHGKKTTFCSS